MRVEEGMHVRSKKSGSVFKVEIAGTHTVFISHKQGRESYGVERDRFEREYEVVAQLIVVLADRIARSCESAHCNSTQGVNVVRMHGDNVVLCNACWQAVAS